MEQKTKAFKWLILLYVLFVQNEMYAQNDTVEYSITVDQELVEIAGEEKMGMTINGSIPSPTLRFSKGDYAIIHVTNEMDVETSIHWHGILLPNFLDGVPYLTTPPIEPGENFTYEFELIQAGTYWYHSHTRLQEQDGVFGSMGQKMERLCNSNRITQSGYHQTSSKYQARNCSGCPLRGACFKGKNNRIVERNHALERYKQQARENSAFGNRGNQTKKVDC